MIPILIMAMVAAYGRLVRGDPMPHVLIVAVVGGIFSVLTSPLVPESLGLIAILLNMAIFFALFFAGHFIGKWLDRDKYLDYGDDEEAV